MRKLTKKERFSEKVLSKFNLYNSIFSTLPYESIADTGQLLPLFTEVCNKGYNEKKDPKFIVETFFNKYCENYSEKEKIGLLFRFIQYVERQVVLFDAIEDAAFSEINNMDGVGTLRNLKELVETSNKKSELKKYLNKFKVRPVLTAHPTQFYPGSVLGIITDLSAAVRNNDHVEIKNLLSQLGKTPFFKSNKPTPYDEAVSLSWYLENVFYNSIGNIFKYIKTNIFDNDFNHYDLLSLGFWPGGDRDGNPFVTTEITIKTAQKLRSDIIKNYYRDVRSLRRRLTFKKIHDIIIKIEDDLYASIFETSKKPRISLDKLISKLEFVKQTIINEHKSLFVDKLDELIDKIKIFGYHFATLDIRQDSRIHSKVFEEIFRKAFSKDFPDNYSKLSIKNKIKILSKLKGKKIAMLFHGSPYGREAIMFMDMMCKKHGCEHTAIEVPHPGNEQQSQWLKIRKMKPDYVLLRGWGVMNPVAMQTAVRTGFSVGNLIGNIWSNSDGDVIPAGDAAEGYYAITTHPAGRVAKVIDDIVDTVYSAGKGDLDDKSRIGSVYWNLGVLAGVFHTEALRIAQERFGPKVNSAQVRWGFENLRLDKARLDELGATGLVPEINITCMDHVGGHLAKFQQWSAKKRQWSVASDWIEGDVELSQSIIDAGAEAYAKEQGITPRDCSKNDGDKDFDL